MLLLTSSLVVIASDDISLAQAKEKFSLSSLNHHSTTTQTSKPGGLAPGITGGFAEHLTHATANNSAAALATVHRLAITSVNASKTQATLVTPCLPDLNRFILQPKEARFTVIKQCVTITGTVVWTHYFNDDGDANFNVALDATYKGMLAPGNYDNKYVLHNKPAIAALHLETICQGPVTSVSGENVGACNGYDGPNFKPDLPKLGQHVMVTGRYLIEFPEVAGGLAELHPVYGIKIIP